jgi:predicted Zn-dependent protease
LKPLAAQPKADAYTLTLLGNAYMASGKPELALQQFEKAAALEPNNPTIETRMAISEIGVGQGKEGLAELERVFSKEAGVPIAGPTLVLAQLRAGQLDKAAGVAAALVKRDGNNPLYLTLVGMVKAAQKDVAGAEAAFHAALAQNPDFTPAMNDLAALYLLSGRPDDTKKVYQIALANKPDDVNALLGLANVAINQKNGRKRPPTSTARALSRQMIRRPGWRRCGSMHCKETGPMLRRSPAPSAHNSRGI